MKKVTTFVMILLILTGLAWLGTVAIDNIDDDNNIGDNVDSQGAEDTLNPLLIIIDVLPTILLWGGFIGVLYFVLKQTTNL